MCAVSVAPLLDGFSLNTRHLFYFMGNLVRAKPRGIRTEGETRRVPLCRIVTHSMKKFTDEKREHLSTSLVSGVYSDLRPAVLVDQ